jgi:hypothetical protein
MNKEMLKIVKLINLTLSHFQIITSEIEFVSSQKNLQQCLNKFGCVLHQSNWTFTYWRRSYRIIQLFVCQKKQWVFFLRIEDTDQNRFVPVPKNISWKH